MSKIFVIGNVTLDYTYRVPKLPNDGETILASGSMFDLGGKGLNQAVAAARCGAEVEFFAVLGHDARAEEVRDSLNRITGLTPVFHDFDGPSDESIIWVEDTGENRIVSMAVCANAYTPNLATNDLRGAKPGDIVVLQGNLNPETTAQTLRAAREAGLLTVLNPAPMFDGAADLTGLVDRLIVNSVEAAALFGSDDPAIVSQKAARDGVTIVTLGDQGAFMIHRNTTDRLPAKTVTAKDTAGAGDALTGAFAAGLAAGLDDRAALRSAMDFAADVVAQNGTYSAILNAPRPDVLDAIKTQSTKMA